MPETLPAYLKRRAQRSFRYLRDEAGAITPEEAAADHDPNWPDHEWGIGQNGSIAGIVYHVAAWKTMTLPLLTDNKLLFRADLEAQEAGMERDWPALVAWLDEIGAAWNVAVESLPESAFDELRDWAGTSLPVSKLVQEMTDHDIQHAAQIEYLRQKRRALQQAGK